MKNPGTPRVPRAAAGFTLLELMVTLSIAVVLIAIAIPGYAGYRQRLDVGTAVADISRIRLAVEQFRVAQGRIPNNLAEIGKAGMLDPWGRPYQYLSFTAGTPGWMGMRRKDRNLVPINSEYDLYSKGADGASQPPLTSRASQDDIVMANDGSFIGLASDY